MNNGRKIPKLLCGAASFAAPLGAGARRSCNGVAVVAAILLLFHTGLANAVQDDEDRPISEMDREIQNQLDELGMTLKAASTSGALSSEEATRIYMIVAERLKGQMSNGSNESAKKGTGGTANNTKTSAGAANVKTRRLSAPRPKQISVLFQPEFRQRDLSVLSKELDLQEDQIMIADVLLGSYLEALDLASSPLRESIGRYRRSSTDQWLKTVLDRVQIDELNVAVAVRNTRAFVERYEREVDAKIAARGASSADLQEKRRAEDDWGLRVIEATARLDERLASLRERIGLERADLERPGARITANDLVRMARQLRYERAQLRADMSESLAAIISNKQAGENKVRFKAAMALVWIDRLLPQGSLGGESMNFGAALTETERSRNKPIGQTERLDEAEAMLRERAPWIAQKLDRRTETTLDRELAGLEFQAAQDQIAAANGGSIYSVDQTKLANALRPFAEYARREVRASVAVRDALLTLLHESVTFMDEMYPDTGLSDIYREAALRRGFPDEMRRRWSQRALAAAMQLDNLDDEALEALLVIETNTSNELQALRADSIAKRIQRDPKLARDRVDVEFGGERRKVESSRQWWLDINYEAFASIDDRTEIQLRAILTSEQIEMLPARKRAEGQEASKARGGQKR